MLHPRGVTFINYVPTFQVGIRIEHYASFVPIFKWGPGHEKWILPENISVAVVAIAEEKAGKGIYRQILREDLSFLN